MANSDFQIVKFFILHFLLYFTTILIVHYVCSLKFRNYEIIYGKNKAEQHNGSKSTAV